MFNSSKLVGVFSVCLTLGFSQVFGHEGHGHTPVGEGGTAKHYLTEPVHLAEVLSVVALIATLGWLAYRWLAARNHSHKVAP